MSDTRCAREKGSELATRAGLGELFECGAAREHQGDDRRDEMLAKRKRTEDREQRDDVHAKRSAPQRGQQIDGERDQDRQRRRVEGDPGEQRRRPGTRQQARRERGQDEPEQEAPHASSRCHTLTPRLASGCVVASGGRATPVSIGGCRLRAALMQVKPLGGCHRSGCL